MPPHPWGTLDLPHAGWAAVRVGLRDLWLERRKDEVRLSHAAVEDVAAPQEPAPPEDASWTRWALPSGSEGQVRLSPAFPDRLLVLQPEIGLFLAKGARARIYARVPLFVRVEVNERDPVLLEELFCATLSDTWWGTFMEGEMAYWLPTSAEPAWSPETVEPHVALCPMQLVNRGDSKLNVEKVALRAANLTLFEKDGAFWSDETEVLHYGDPDTAELRVSGRPPEEAKGAHKAASPREPVKGGLRGRTFSRLLNLSPMPPAR